ncbi:MAG: 16S rRNA (guanine(527)-N(7))-methyltransferase RsmG [bacterium]
MENQTSKEIFVRKIGKYLNNFRINPDYKDFDNQTLEKFYVLYSGLIEWNKKINITTITDEDGFIKKHIVDSAFLLKILDKKSKYIMDVGSGAGFPGIILNILNPSLNIISIESILKKCNFQKNISRKLALYNFECLNLNIFSHKNFNNVDAITTRAAFNVKELTGLIERLDLTKCADLYLFLSRMDEAKKIENFKYKSKQVRLDRILFYKTDYNTDNNSDFRLIAKFKAAPVQADGLKKIF